MKVPGFLVPVPLDLCCEPNVLVKSLSYWWRLWTYRYPIVIVAQSAFTVLYSKITSQCHWTSIKPSWNDLTFQTIPFQFIQFANSALFHTGTGIDPDDIVYLIITVDLTQGHHYHKTYLKPSSISFVVFQWDAVRKIEIYYSICKWKKSEFIFGILYKKHCE